MLIRLLVLVEHALDDSGAWRFSGERLVEYGIILDQHHLYLKENNRSKSQVIRLSVTKELGSKERNRLILSD